VLWLSGLYLYDRIHFLVIATDFVVGGRVNKLYIPENPKPHGALFVMLHGCTQDPLDFSKGTDMVRFILVPLFYAVYYSFSCNCSRNFVVPVFLVIVNSFSAIVSVLTV
jgi:hypothetical protein